MLKKTFITSAIVSALFLSFSGIASATPGDKSVNKAPVTDRHSMASDAYGEIVGQFNSPDGTVVGATLPGKSVSFTIPVKKGAGQYLHFAFMHAGSAEDGWFFAPESDHGINLSGLIAQDDKTVNITDQIALFSAPAADQLARVTTDKGKLKAGTASQFMTAELTRHKGMYVVTIKNVSKGNYETPFSSGVWGVTKTAVQSFDHTPSAALSKLATSGHRGDLYAVVTQKIPQQNRALSMELTQGAVKMAGDEMKDHKKIGSISGMASTQNDLEKKFAMAAAQMGARYYVITSLTNKNHTFGNADIYE